MHEVDRDLDRDVAGAAAAHQRLLDALDGSHRLEPDRPTRTASITLADLLESLVADAAALIGVLGDAPTPPLEKLPRDASTRRVTAAGTAAGGSAGAAPLSDLTRRVRQSIWGLESAWAGVSDWSGSAEVSPGVTMARREVPFRRWRAVEMAHIEADLGYDFGDLPTEYLRLELRRQEMIWRARRPMGLGELPDAVLELPPHARLAWFVRGDPRDPTGPLLPRDQD